jgi:hypothetical protein
MKSTVRIDFLHSMLLGDEKDPLGRWKDHVTVEKVSIVQGGMSFDYAGHARVVPTHNILMLTYESPTNVEVVTVLHEHNSGCIEGGILDCDGRD